MPFLCCNRELSRFVKEKLDGTDKIDFWTYGELVEKAIGGDYNSVKSAENGNQACFEAIAEAHPARYDSI